MAHMQQFTHHALYALHQYRDRRCFDDAANSSVLARYLFKVNIGRCNCMIIYNGNSGLKFTTLLVLYNKTLAMP